MEWTYLINELNINKKQLDEKKQQTDYKIKYIIEYMIRWLQVNVHRPDITDINYVDCMCNAGIYQDGDLCTSMEVLLLFVNIASLHHDKRFNLFINDKDKTRTDICSKIAEKLLCVKEHSNVNIYINSLDVNQYLQDFSLFDKYFRYGGATVLFVDPYDFGTVIIDRLTSFITRYYCEVIFNFFISDYVRNGIDRRIRTCIGDVKISNKEELIAYIVSCLKVGKMQYVFSYQFRTSTNTELYQIIFATPHIKGLEVLKEALWETFNGRFFHRNYETDPKQITLFTDDDDRQVLLSTHARLAKELLQKNFSSHTVAYEQIELFLTENTMMKKTDFLRSVLKPLIEKRLVIKQGIPKNKSNYKDDMYTFIKGIL